MLKTYYSPFLVLLTFLRHLQAGRPGLLKESPPHPSRGSSIPHQPDLSGFCSWETEPKPHPEDWEVILRHPLWLLLPGWSYPSKGPGLPSCQEALAWTQRELSVAIRGLRPQGAQHTILSVLGPPGAFLAILAVSRFPGLSCVKLFFHETLVQSFSKMEALPLPPTPL